MTQTTKTLLIVASLVCATGGAACQRTPGEAQKDAYEAQQQADHKTLEAKQEANTKIAEGNQDGQRAIDERNQEAAAAQAAANEKIREANRDVSAGLSETRDWAQKKLDDVDQMIDEAKTKAQGTKTPAAKANFNVAIKDVQEQRDALKAETLALETRGGESLDKGKAQFSDSVDRIKDRIRGIEKAL